MFVFSFPAKLLKSWAIAGRQISLSALFGLSLSGCQTLPSAFVARDGLAWAGVRDFAPMQLEYQVHQLPTSTVYTLRIPLGSRFELRVEADPGLAAVEVLAQRGGGAIAGINAGFFDPANGQTTAYIIQEGILTGDPQQNQQLMTNAGIQTYLPQVLNRSEFRRYRCGETTRYAITSHDTEVPSDCLLTDAVGAGPQLLPRLNAEEEAFWHEVEGKIKRDPIGLYRPNARSAIALTANGDVILAMAAQIPGSGSGLTLPELADFLQTQGAISALNLDGGSSSALYYSPTTHYGKFDTEGQAVRRAVKSALIVRPPQDPPQDPAP